MEKTYNPELIEQKYRELWEKGDLFSSSANSSSRDAFSIVLPPPNVTGSLHMGHAFQHTIMDVYTHTTEVREIKLCGNLEPIMQE